MSSWLLFLLKSTVILCLLYLLFRLLLQKEPLFNQSRFVLIVIVLVSVIIPFLYLPSPIQSIVPTKIDPIIQRTVFNEGSSNLIRANSATVYSPNQDSPASKSSFISPEKVVLFVYFAGVFLSLFRLIYSVTLVLLLFKKSKRANKNGIPIMIVNDDIPAFSFRKYILISQYDYKTNPEAILTHELSHIKQGHFYDLMLMELVKIIYWFNPIVYFMYRDMKEIHEYQADEHTLNAGVDVIKYQLLIIQKSVGQQKFALANSFNHCQIKNRITMMNKSKNSNVWSWKVVAFFPVIVFLLMAFSRKSEFIPDKNDLGEETATSEEITQNQYEQFRQKIEIRKEGNYINNQLQSLDQITVQDRKWREASNDWIFLLIDESIPLKRIDEVRGALKGNYWVVQSTVNSNDPVYYSGDVNQLAEFTQGRWNEWIKNQLKDNPEIKSLEYTLSYSFIIDKNGKVRDGHLTKACKHSEVNDAYENVLSKIPDWEPAMRGNDKVSVYYNIGVYNSLTKKN